MKTTLSLLLIGCLVLAGCGGWSNSRANPSNWFGSSQQVPAEVIAEAGNPLIPKSRTGVFSRPAEADNSILINKITLLRIEPTTSGAIVYAEGVATRQGMYNTRLRPINLSEIDENGLLTLELRGVYPEEATPVGSEFSRTVHEAHVLSRQELAKIRTVRVVGKNNALETRRR